MPRKPREFVDGGIYHVYNRGNNRMDIFRETQDYSAFRSQLIKSKELYPADIFHYCFMTNHFHLLVRTHIGNNLAKFMQKVQLGYAVYFMRKYGYGGHVFQERYKSPRISEESYYLQCGRYIERNPVQAGMVENANAYPHSSARYYVLGIADELITENPYYQQLGTCQGEQRLRYSEFLSLEEPYDKALDNYLCKL